MTRRVKGILAWAAGLAALIGLFSVLSLTERVRVAQQIVNGLSLGGVYALIAIGYTMVYGIIRLINFAHGDVYMVGAFIAYWATSRAKLGFLPALLLAMVGAAVLGVIIERGAYRPLRRAPRIAALITAIGVSLLLEYGFVYLFSPQVRTFPQDVLPSNTLQIAGVFMDGRQIALLVVAAVLMAALTIFVTRTTTGKAMRACAHDQEAARLMGIDVDKVISLTFAIGSALAAAAGVMVGLVFASLSPLMGILPGLKAFVAAVVGGIGSLPGAMAGGMLMGVAESLVSGFISSKLRDVVAFALLIFVLLVRPGGLFGTAAREKV